MLQFFLQLDLNLCSRSDRFPIFSMLVSTISSDSVLSKRPISSKTKAAPIKLASPIISAELIEAL
jgi:hypothetical protein